MAFLGRQGAEEAIFPSVWAQSGMMLRIIQQ